MAMRRTELVAVVVWLVVGPAACGDDDGAPAVVDAANLVADAPEAAGLGSSCSYNPATHQMVENCLPPFAPNDCIDSTQFPAPGEGYCSPSCGSTGYPQVDAKPATCGIAPPAGGDAVCQALAPAGWTAKCELCSDTGSGLDWVCTIRCNATEPACPANLVPVDSTDVCVCVR